MLLSCVSAQHPSKPLGRESLRECSSHLDSDDENFFYIETARPVFSLKQIIKSFPEYPLSTRLENADDRTHVAEELFRYTYLLPAAWYSNSGWINALGLQNAARRFQRFRVIR